mgnify:CR=1 FL=1
MAKRKSESGSKEVTRQLAELTAALQRERADALNVRRRAEQEKEKMASFYKAIIIQGLLPAVDNLERALLHVPKDLRGHSYVKGVQSVAKQFEKAFSDLGVKRIKTVGEHFNPRYHEAVSLDEGEGQNEVIAEELQSGYVIDGEVIRPAMVKVKRS